MLIKAIIPVVIVGKGSRELVRQIMNLSRTLLM